MSSYAVFIQGSLQNFDEDGDGVPDGFMFKLRNRYMTICITRITAKLDGEPLDPDKISFIVDSNETKASQITATSPFCIPVDTTTTVKVFKRGGLKPGIKSRLNIVIEVPGYGTPGFSLILDVDSRSISIYY